ncbi:hypothetical protein ASPTUDRAFT_137491, partial [Aspergillus tubingensis CBS 134.48]
PELVNKDLDILYIFKLNIIFRISFTSNNKIISYNRININIVTTIINYLINFIKVLDLNSCRYS